MIRFVPAWLILMSLAAFAAFGIDKYRAKHGLWRIPERTLFTLALLGGGPGALLGMKFFRHKTRQKRFTIGIPLIMILQLTLAGWIIWKTNL